MSDSQVSLGQWHPEWTPAKPKRGKKAKAPPSEPIGDILSPSLPARWSKVKPRGDELVAAASEVGEQRIALTRTGYIRRTSCEQHIVAPTVAMVAWLMREAGEVLARPQRPATRAPRGTRRR